MARKIIDAGFGKTRTESMKPALDMPCYGPCYHMYEVMPHKPRYEAWQDIFDGVSAFDWDAIFDGCRATVGLVRLNIFDTLFCLFFCFAALCKGFFLY